MIIQKIIPVIFIFCSFFLVFPNTISAKIEIYYSTPSASIQSDQEFSLDVTISGATDTSEYYLRGAFSAPSTTNYFGLTQHGSGQWISSGSNYQLFPKIIGNQTLSLKFKPDPSHTGFHGSGEYHFKIGRYTPSGSLTWSEQVAEITIIAPSPTPTPTPTVIPSNTPVSSSLPTPINQTVISNIRLSEVFACPSNGEAEWVEVFNENDHPVILENWMIRDNTSTNKKQFTLNIASHSFGVVETQSLLNNSGDSVRLLNNLQIEVDGMRYEDCSPSTSYIFYDNKWLETAAPTKGSNNDLSISDNFSSTTSDKSSPTHPTSSSPNSQDTGLLNTQKPIPTITRESASSSATVSGIVLGSTIELADTFTDPMEESEEPQPPSKLPLLFLISGSLLLLSAGLFGVYQWYNFQ